MNGVEQDINTRCNQRSEKRALWSRKRSALCTLGLAAMAFGQGLRQTSHIIKEPRFGLVSQKKKSTKIIFLYCGFRTYDIKG